jgi:exopolysaccharide biosynthesis polyprenyl glycosylphosphotransferase
VFGLSIAMVFGLYLAGLHRGDVIHSYSLLEIRIFLGLAGAAAAFMLFEAIFVYSLIGRFVVIYSIVLGNIGVLLSRVLYNHFASRYARNIVLVGSSAAYKHLTKSLLERRLPYNVSGWVPSRCRGDNSAPIPTGDILSVTSTQSTDDIIVEVDAAMSKSERDALMSCLADGINVIDMNAFYEENFDCVHEVSIDERWFWAYDPVHAHPYYQASKRLIDVVVSTVGIITTVPLLPIIACAIKLQDGGPVLYKQLRAGRYNRPFMIWKFRTMRVDAERTGAQWAARGDKRVTFLGKILRKSRLDELPQFWNVLCGEMSFVGPRPERPEMIETLEKEIPFYRYRHLMKPGLSGWAQINYPYGASVEDARRKLAYDLYYIKHASIALDVLIIVRTALAMAKGAR